MGISWGNASCWVHSRSMGSTQGCGICPTTQLFACEDAMLHRELLALLLVK